MNARAVIEMISRAFPLEPVPAPGLYATHAGDQLYMGNISQEIRMLNCAMAHQSPEGFVYFLPAYLCVAVRQLEAGDVEDRNMLVCDACFQVGNPGKDEYQLRRLARLTDAQRRAIIAFLEYIVGHADAHESVQARKALERYWRKTVTPPA
jgi:hypothetical protein